MVTYSPGYFVVWIEMDQIIPNRIGEWIGSLIITTIDDNRKNEHIRNKEAEKKLSTMLK